MAAVWDRTDLDSSERLVMLSLADHADDQGRCYPSIRRLCERTSMSDRGVQKVLQRLSERGFIKVQPNAGQGGANLYRVLSTPERGSPPEPCSPRTEFTTPPNPVRKTPEPGSPKPSGTVIEPSEKKARDADAIMDALTEVVRTETAAAYVAHRKAKRAKLTLHAAHLIAGKIRGHPDPDAVVMESIANGWTGVFPKPTQTNGAKHDRQRFDRTINAIADGLTSGTVGLGLESRDPFAARRGGNA